MYLQSQTIYAHLATYSLVGWGGGGADLYMRDDLYMRRRHCQGCRHVPPTPPRSPASHQCSDLASLRPDPASSSAPPPQTPPHKLIARQGHGRI